MGDAAVEELYCWGRAEAIAGGRGLVGLGGSGCWSVLVDEPCAGGASDLVVELDHDRVAFIGGCSLVEAAKGPVLVMVHHELFEEPVQLALVPDQGPIE